MAIKRGEGPKGWLQPGFRKFGEAPSHFSLEHPCPPPGSLEPRDSAFFGVPGSPQCSPDRGLSHRVVTGPGLYTFSKAVASWLLAPTVVDCDCRSEG